MKRIRVEDAVGQRLAHDVARIIIGNVKDTPFRRGQCIEEKDIEALKNLGKEHVFVEDGVPTELLHEEEVAVALYELCQSESVYAGPVEQGKIEVFAAVDGIFDVDADRLLAINSIGELTIVTAQPKRFVRKGDKLAGLRCIPLWLDPSEVKEAQSLCADGKPVFSVTPVKRKRLGVVVTGSEVASGRIEDAFTGVIEKRVAPLGIDIIARKVVTDDKALIEEAIRSVKGAGADLVFCTGGMSVDPDDLTPGAMRSVARECVTYGLPILPGSMVCICYFEDGTPLIGLPGGVLFSEPSAFDWLLPRVVGDEKIRKADCVALGLGGLLK